MTAVDYPSSYEDWDIYDTTFNYDEAKNRTSIIEDGTTTTNYTTNGLNQYTTVGDVWYEYDNNANLTYDSTSYYSYDPRII